MTAEPTREQGWWADEEVRRRNAAKPPGACLLVAGWRYDPAFPYGVTLLLAPSGHRFVYFPEGLR